MWPEHATVIVAFDLETRRRIPFGTEAAAPVPLKAAVAASAAVPLVFQPVRIHDRWYADGGIASGTSADLVLANPDPLDLVIVIAPLAAEEDRPGTRLIDSLFDRVGREALDAELATLTATWPQCEVLVFTPDSKVLAAARPNPLSVTAAVPSFLRTLMAMRAELAHRDVWTVVEGHLVLGRADSIRGLCPCLCDELGGFIGCSAQHFVLGLGRRVHRQAKGLLAPLDLGDSAGQRRNLGPRLVKLPITDRQCCGNLFQEFGDLRRVETAFGACELRAFDVLRRYSHEYAPFRVPEVSFALFPANLGYDHSP